MDSHSTSDEPPGESINRFYTLLGGFIAVLTLTLPLYITSHYSSGNVLTHTPESQTASPPVRR